MRRPLLARNERLGVTTLVTLAVVVAGCAAIAGINDGADSKSTASTDAAVTVPIDAPRGDAMATSCPRQGNAEDTPTTMHASKVQTPVVIDGESADWACVDRFRFDGGERVVGLAPGRGVADVAMQWDVGHLYVWASVTTSSPAGTAPRGTNYQNDSLSFFVSQPMPTSTYTASDHQIVLDSTNLLADYDIDLRPGLAGIQGKAGSVRDDGSIVSFVVELEIDASVVGRTAFAANDTVRVNFQINDGPGATPGYRIWMVDPNVCTAFGNCDLQGTSVPSCDPRCTGTVTLR